MATLVVPCTTSVLTHRAKAVGIVDEKAEIVFVLVLANLRELALVAGHAEDTLRDDKDAAAGLVCQVLGTHELLFKALHVVVLEHKALALVQTNAVHHARMRLTVVHNDVVARHQRLNGGLAPLVTKVEQERIFLLHEVCEFLFKGFVLRRLA